MLTFAGFFAPYLFALAAFPVLVRRGSFLWMVPIGACILMMSSPWLIPPESAMLRFIASISAAMLALKVIDVSHDLALHRKVSWQATANMSKGICQKINVRSPSYLALQR